MKAPSFDTLFPVGSRPWHKRAAAALLGAALVMAPQANATPLAELIAPWRLPASAVASLPSAFPASPFLSSWLSGASPLPLSLPGVSPFGSPIVEPLAEKETPENGLDPDFAAQLHESNSVSASHSDLPYVELGRLDSDKGELKEQFLLRVSQVLNAFTLRTRHEACAAIMQSTAEDPTWRVRLTTNRSQIACVRMLHEEEGFSYTGETIHSHPRPRKYEGMIRIRANAMDSRLRSFPCGQRIAVEDHTFSPGDRANGPGYLVARGQLLYLTAGGQERVVGKIDEAAPLPQLVAGDAVSAKRPQNPMAAAVQAWGLEEVEGLPSVRCPRFK